jgi:hypothetical protein
VASNDCAKDLERCRGVDAQRRVLF